MKRDRIDRRERTRLNDRVKYIQLNFRRMNFTLVGDAGRPWRRLIAAGAGLIALILALVFGGAETHLLASPEVRQVQEQGMIRVGVRYDLPGLNGEGGLEHEIATIIAQRIFPEEDPYNVLELVEVSSITASTKLDDGAVDMVIAMMCPEMATHYNFSSSYYSDDCVMVVPSGTKSFPLRNAELGCIQSNKLRTSAEDALLAAYIAENPDLNLKVENFASYPDLLDALLAQRIDGAIIPLSIFERYRTQYGVVRTSVTIGAANYAVMCASDTTVFAEIATLVIEELRESGELDRMKAERGI